MDENRHQHGRSTDTRPVPGLARVTEKIGPYRVKRMIASGGMGTVYEAVQERPRRTVAVKVMKHGVASQSSMRRFEYEAQVLARLHHPAIAQVYEAGTHRDGTGIVPFFAMEYIPNAKSITDYANENKLDARGRLKLFATVCDAVHHGHLKGIIHRDLKPANLLVNAHGDLKVIDFGVARGTDSDLAAATLQTDVGQLVGTLQFMSPEQCRGDPHDIDPRSDVYALGVTLYQLLSSKLPYDVREATIIESTRIVCEQPPTRLSHADASLRGEVETIVLKALEKDRERRYQSAFGLAQDIQRFLAGEAIVARSPSLAYKLTVFARRHKAALGALTAVFVVLVAAVIISTSLYVQAETARRDAMMAKEAAERARAAEVEHRKLAEDRFFSLPKNISEVTPAEAKRLLDKDDSYVYLDVRTVGEFTNGHVPGALNIPVATRNPTAGQMEMNERLLPVVRAVIPTDTPVIVGCRSGRRSARATRLMVEAGYEHAVSMAGGFIAKKDGTGRIVIAGWSELGYPIERGSGGAASYASLAARAESVRKP